MTNLFLIITSGLMVSFYWSAIGIFLGIIFFTFFKITKNPNLKKILPSVIKVCFSGLVLLVIFVILYLLLQLSDRYLGTNLLILKRNSFPLN